MPMGSADGARDKSISFNYGSLWAKRCGATLRRAAPTPSLLLDQVVELLRRFDQVVAPEFRILQHLLLDVLGRGIDVLDPLLRDLAGFEGLLVGRAVVGIARQGGLEVWADEFRQRLHGEVFVLRALRDDHAVGRQHTLVEGEAHGRALL